ncbi:hypothetical protein SUDANB108_04542 [Streptomyces sp. enrichment culture]
MSDTNNRSLPLVMLAVVCIIVGVLLVIAASGSVWMYVAAAALGLAGISLLTNKFGLGKR